MRTTITFNLDPEKLARFRKSVEEFNQAVARFSEQLRCAIHSQDAFAKVAAIIDEEFNGPRKRYPRSPLHKAINRYERDQVKERHRERSEWLKRV